MSNLKPRRKTGVACRVGAGLAPGAPHGPVREQFTHTVRQRWPLRAKDLADNESPRRHDCCCPSEHAGSDCLAICASFVETVGGLKVPPAFPQRRRHAWHCLPALLRVLSWVPWASVPHASEVGSRPLPRYCALLRLPSSFPVGPLVAPFRYLGLTHYFSCSSRLSPGWAHP